MYEKSGLIYRDLILYLSGGGNVMVREFAVKAILMHDPTTLLSFRSSAFVKDKSFLHPEK